MNVIHFNYSGLINGEEISGNAILQADSESGVIQGNASFSSLPGFFYSKPRKLVFFKYLL